MKNKRIELGNGYVADIGPHSIVLKNNVKPAIDKEGNEFESSDFIGDYGNLAAIMKRVLREEVTNELPPVATIPEFMKVYVKTVERIDKMFEHFKI